MGFKRRIITSDNKIHNIGDTDLIDSPSRLLQFAEMKGITRVPLDLVRICEEFKIVLSYQTLIDLEISDVSGILRKINWPNNEKKSCWQMIINKKHNNNRQRFTIAHELGHYCLHRRESQTFIDQVFFRSSLGTDISQKMEWQANDFAASILMPREEIVKLRDSNFTDIEELASHFQVSLLAMRFQLLKLEMQ